MSKLNIMTWNVDWFRNGIHSGYNDGIYEGEAVEKIPNGKGIITFKDGSRYEGIFINGVLMG